MNTSNWAHDTDRGHPNFTGRTPRVSKYDGVGGWAKDSSRIPLAAWPGAIVVIAIFAALLYVGGAVGF